MAHNVQAESHGWGRPTLSLGGRVANTTQLSTRKVSPFIPTRSLSGDYPSDVLVPIQLRLSQVCICRLPPLRNIRSVLDPWT